MLPGLFFLQQVRELDKVCQEAGFRGEGEGRWQWLNSVGEGVFRQWEINWIRVWRRVGVIYIEVQDNK
jgi:hypothetical protein